MSSDSSIVALTQDEVKEHFKGGAIQADRSMSNCDHTIDEGLEEELKEDPRKYADYAGWNFHGDVFYMKGQFHCVVMRHHQFMETIFAQSLQEIMDKVSEKYGAD